MMTPTCLPDPAEADRAAPGRPLVLLVDDDATGRDALAHLIDAAGLECRGVGSGLEALDVCRDQVPRLVITDLCMPGLDGQGLGLRLRGLFPGLALILITAQALDPPQLAELLAIFDDVLPKPVDPIELLDRVTRLAP